MAEAKGKLILIAGGARSGKSRAALHIARKGADRRLYIATAQAFDSEMSTRIEKHKSERPDFETFEEPRDLRRLPAGQWDTILIDCLTLWISNLMMDEQSDDEIHANILDGILHVRKQCSQLIIISNEVGLGIVPDNKMARRFRDLTGFLQQAIGQDADNVYFAFAGRILPMHQLGEDIGCL